MSFGINFFTIYLEHLTYIGIITVLLGAGLGLPISEDLILLISGFLAYYGIISPVLAFPVCYVGIISGDLILYSYGWHYGQNILQSGWIKRFTHPELMEKVGHYFDRYGNRTIFFARHLPLVRPITFLLAGAMKIKPGTFLLMDGISALLSVPLVLSIGYFFANQLDQVESILSRIKYLIVVLFLFGTIFLIVRKRYLRS